MHIKSELNCQCPLLWETVVGSSNGCCMWGIDIPPLTVKGWYQGSGCLRERIKFDSPWWVRLWNDCLYRQSVEGLNCKLVLQRRNKNPDRGNRMKWDWRSLSILSKLLTLLLKFLAICHFCPGSNFQVDTTWMMTMCAPDWTPAGRCGWCDEPTHSILWEGSEPLLLP